MRLEKAGRIINGHGTGTDIMVASAKARLNAINKLVGEPGREHPQMGQPI